MLSPVNGVVEFVQLESFHERPPLAVKISRISPMLFLLKIRWKAMTIS